MEYQHWFTALFEGCLLFPLNKQSKNIFAFEWENPQTGQRLSLPGLCYHKDLRIVQ